MLRHSCRRIGSTNRYTDGSGRALDGNTLPTELYVPPISNRAYPSRGEHWQPVVAHRPSPHKGNVIVSGAGVVGLTVGCLFALRGWHVTVLGRTSAQWRSALLTRRAADVLHMAGLQLPALREVGVVVRGVLDHSAAYRGWVTRGLVELHRFAVPALAVDLAQLRRRLEQHLGELPCDNVQLFHDHHISAVYPLRQEVVVGRAEPAEHVGRRCTETSLTLSAARWQRDYAAGAVHYDLLVCAEGVNARLRDLLDVEGMATDEVMGVRWFVLHTRTLSHEHVHRWLHWRPCAAPFVLAFPRPEGADVFAVMVYAATTELQAWSDAAVLHELMPDLTSAELRACGPGPTPAPTIFCENLFNSVGLPAAVVVGDAAHHCHPWWMQGLAMGLEDGALLLNQVDAYSRHFYDAVRQYSTERGVAGDALREVTARCLYYEQHRHVNPWLRLRNGYLRAVRQWLPGWCNTRHDSLSNYYYARSLEEMFNGRGYTSYEYAEKQQSKHNRYFYLGRLYT